jgi:hypothetical protein
MALDVIRLIPRLNGAAPSQRDRPYLFCVKGIAGIPPSIRVFRRCPRCTRATFDGSRGSTRFSVLYPV